MESIQQFWEEGFHTLTTHIQFNTMTHCSLLARKVEEDIRLVAEGHVIQSSHESNRVGSLTRKTGRESLDKE